MRNINITEQEIDNFLTTEEGEELTQPEYRVIQALLLQVATRTLQWCQRKSSS